MAQGDARSLQQIRQETEQARSDLMHTVEQLRTGVTETSRDIRERMKPAAIKGEVTHYVRSRGEQWLQGLKTAARENPLQAVAVCGSVAYPLLRLMRKIPAPILMIGAGLFLVGSKSGKSATEQISSAANGLKQAVTRQAETVGGHLNETKANVGAHGAELQESMAQKAGNATEAVKEFSDQAAAAGQRYTQAAGDAAESALQSAKKAGSDLRDRATRTFTETLEQNPLVIAGIGLLIGGVVAGALPRTDLEDELLGETRQSVKRRAQSAASRGLDAARDAAGEGARRASEQARKEGLDRDGIREGMRDVGERVRRVTEAAVTTAFEPPEENGQSDHQGANSHG